MIGAQLLIGSLPGICNFAPAPVYNTATPNRYCYSPPHIPTPAISKNKKTKTPILLFSIKTYASLVKNIP
jgi:hypothetical protein